MTPMAYVRGFIPVNAIAEAAGPQSPKTWNSSRSRTAMSPLALPRLVCAQHGHVVNGVQVPCRNTRNEKRLPSEANCVRATERGKEG